MVTRGTLDTIIVASILVVEMLLELMPGNTAVMADSGSFTAANHDCMVDLIALVTSDITIYMGVIIIVVIIVLKSIHPDYCLSVLASNFINTNSRVHIRGYASSMGPFYPPIINTTLVRDISLTTLLLKITDFVCYWLLN